MKTRRVLVPLSAACMVSLSAGCHAPAQPPGPTVARITAETPDEYEQLFTAAEDTLRFHYFQPDRTDRQQGVITTHRDTTGNWFEFWRPQPQPVYYWVESNLHAIQRQATVHIRPSDEQGTYQLDVQVDRYRYRLEERQVDNAAGALRIFSSDAPTYFSRTLYSTAAEASPEANAEISRSSYWIHLGRDEPMENAILAAIIRRYGRTVVTDTSPEELTARKGGREPF